MSTVFFLLILPVLQGIGLLLLLLGIGGIIASYIKQVITHYYNMKAAYMKAVTGSDPFGLREMARK